MITIQKFHPHLYSYVKVGCRFQTHFSQMQSPKKLLEVKESILFSALKTICLKQR